MEIRTNAGEGIILVREEIDFDSLDGIKGTTLIYHSLTAEVAKRREMSGHFKEWEH
jgi:hypothetical protein